MMHLFILIATLLFVAGGCIQLYRYFTQSKVKVADWEVPLWVSAVAGGVLWFLAIWGFVLL